MVTRARGGENPGGDPPVGSVVPLAGHDDHLASVGAAEQVESGLRRPLRRPGRRALSIVVDACRPVPVRTPSRRRSPPASRAKDRFSSDRTTPPGGPRHRVGVGERHVNRRHAGGPGRRVGRARGAPARGRRAPVATTSTSGSRPRRGRHRAPSSPPPSRRNGWPAGRRVGHAAPHAVLSSVKTGRPPGRRPMTARNRAMSTASSPTPITLSPASGRPAPAASSVASQRAGS